MTMRHISTDAFDAGIDDATHAVLTAFEGIKFEGEEWSALAIRVNDALTNILSQEMDITP